MKTILVSDVMTREPVTTKPETNLLECAKKMMKKRVKSLAIVHKKRLLGFISQEDIIWALTKKSKEDLGKIKAIDISPKKIVTTKPSVPISEAIEKMKRLKFDRLPVIQNKELVGIITVKDILNFNPEIYPELEEFAQIKEESEKLRRVNLAKDRESVREGFCEECGNQDLLYKSHGTLVCGSCLG